MTKTDTTPAFPELDCGDFGLRIDREGIWSYHGSPITRQPLVRLFASVLQRDAAGDFWLVTPVERGRIQVDDAPFIAVELTVDGNGANQILTLRTNLDDRVAIGENHPLRVETDPASGTPRPYALVRGGLEARLSRSVFYELVELGQEATIDGAALFGVWSNGKFFPLGSLTEPA
ncbi:MAG TPA: DUF1285 domain-containing protein [Stellaceae bacterium]|nr:DUF1285 domain-containing protein [Stellaceae bacterium]